MSELRWILIGFGIVVLAAIYLWGRRSQAPHNGTEENRSRERPEPSLGNHAGANLAASASEGARGARAEPAWHAGSARDDDELSHFDTPVENLADTEDLKEEGEPVHSQSTSPSTPRHTAYEADAPTGYDARAASSVHESWRSRMEPTLGDAPTEELPVEPPARVSEPAAQSGETPRRIERRKILSLRLSLLPNKVGGDKLLECLLAESLEHGRYNVFHRMQADAAVFSVASMVEPGTFDLEKMQEIEYPGITLFAQLPGPVAGMHALNELVACARRLQQGLGGTLQDERGVPLTVHRIERMRQEVREFERPAAGRSGTSTQPVHP